MFKNNTMLKFPTLKSHKPIGNVVIYSKKDGFGPIFMKMVSALKKFKENFPEIFEWL